MVNIKVVDEPTNYGANLLAYQQSQRTSQKTLKTHVAPANFSGPPHLRWLVGKCFSKVIDNYKYELCPFANVTQHEEALRWNAYSGVLGVWQQWSIENNTFVSMMMNEGDMCGSRRRSTEVTFICGNRTVIHNVTEPKTCEYLVELSTPLVCHPDSMLVYPVLSAELQDEWDTIEGLLQQDIITPKGYASRLHDLFIKAGFHLSAEQRESLKDGKSDAQKHSVSEADGFLTLAECSLEYRKLELQIERLRTLLVENGVNMTTIQTLLMHS